MGVSRNAVIPKMLILIKVVSFYWVFSDFAIGVGEAIVDFWKIWLVLFFEWLYATKV